MDENNSNISNFEKLKKDQEEKVRYEVAISLLMLSNGIDRENHEKCIEKDQDRVVTIIKPEDSENT